MEQSLLPARKHGRDRDARDGHSSSRPTTARRTMYPGSLRLRPAVAPGRIAVALTRNSVACVDPLLPPPHGFRHSHRRRFPERARGLSSTMVTQLPLTFFQRLPKTDLHVHLDVRCAPRRSSSSRRSRASSFRRATSRASGGPCTPARTPAASSSISRPSTSRSRSCRPTTPSIASLRAGPGRRTRERAVHGSSLLADAARAQGPAADRGGRDRAAWAA